MIPDKSLNQETSIDEVAEVSKIDTGTVTSKKVDMPTFSDIGMKRPSIEVVSSNITTPIQPQIPKTVVLSRDRNRKKDSKSKKKCESIESKFDEFSVITPRAEK